MDPLEAFLTEDKRARAPAGPSMRVTPAQQAQRDADAQSLLQAEYRRAKAAGENTAELEAEMRFRKMAIPDAAAPSAEQLAYMQEQARRQPALNQSVESKQAVAAGPSAEQLAYMQEQARRQPALNQSVQARQAAAVDPLEAFLSGGAAPAPARPAAPAAGAPGVPAAAPATPAAAPGAMRAKPKAPSTIDSTVPSAEPAPEPVAPEPSKTPISDFVSRVLKTPVEAGKQLYGTLETIRAAAAGGVAVPLSAVGGLIEGVTSGKKLTSPQVQNVVGGIQRIISEPFAPKTEAGQAQAELLGKALEASKLPPIGIPLDVVPPSMGMAARQAAQKARAPIEKMREWHAEMGPAKRSESIAADQIARDFEAKQRSVGAAAVEANPYVGQITGEERVRGQYPQIKLSKIAEDVPPTEQAVRAQIANKVLRTGQVRPGVVTGNENMLRNEYTLAKSAEGGPAGELLKRQIAEEQVALSNFAEERVRATGASENLTTPFERGERINDFFTGTAAEGEPASSITSFFRQEKKRLYDEARNVVGDNPIATSHVDSLLADPQFQAGLKLTSNEGVARGAQELIELAKTTGFKDASGTFYQPNTINAWDAVRKAINAEWTPQNARVVRRINQAIDQDIATAGGGDLLKRADSVHQAEKVMFGSKGIKDAFGEIDSNGVETGKISLDALPQKLNSMPFNQWRHIYDSADRLSRGELRGPIDRTTGEPRWVLQVPPELQQAAAATKAEMLGNLAREIQVAGGAKEGVWNQNSANKIMNARADKIKYAFPLEEQQNLHVLNTAGYLMPGVHHYEGAALQGRRVGALEGALPTVGRTVGGAVGGVVGGSLGEPISGAALGQMAGAKLGERALEKRQARKLTAEAAKLQTQMQKSSKLSEMLPRQ